MIKHAKSVKEMTIVKTAWKQLLVWTEIIDMAQAVCTKTAINVQNYILYTRQWRLALTNTS